MKKIMFNDRYGLTEAVLSGRKTQTRRVVSDKLWDEWTDYDDFCNNAGVAGLGEIGVSVTREYDDEKNFFLENCPYNVGEVVAIAQCYADLGFDCTPIIGMDENGMPEFASETGMYNKMFVRADLMPNRIRITNVRMERLNDISESDCRAEGIDYVNGYSESYFFGFGVKTDKGWIRLGNTPREAYAALIDRISGKGIWESNPYVFVYDFELVK